MQYPGYLRYFDSTVRLLAERGHHVDVVFDSPHKQPEGSEALDGVQGITWLGQTPRRDDVWGVVGKAVRGAIDYLRYLHPKFADAHYLRARMRDVLPPVFSFLGRWQSASVSTTRRAIAPFLACERAIPSSPILEAFIRSREPDALLVTPLVDGQVDAGGPRQERSRLWHARGSVRRELGPFDDEGSGARAARSGVSVEPGAVAEAVEFHDTPRDRIVVTGAQPFDRWFKRQPTSRAAFCAKVGLDPAQAVRPVRGIDSIDLGTRG